MWYQIPLYYVLGRRSDLKLKELGTMCPLHTLFSAENILNHFYVSIEGSVRGVRGYRVRATLRACGLVNVGSIQYSKRGPINVRAPIGKERDDWELARLKAAWESVTLTELVEIRDAVPSVFGRILEFTFKEEDT